MNRKGEMEKKTAIMLQSFLYITFLTSQINGRKQGEGLFHSYKLNSKIDRSNFNASYDFQGAQVHPQTGLKERDRIERLPGQPEVQFKQYGGYVTVNRAAGRALYYYFAEAHHSHNSSPLLLWLNGGPGCSSLGYGAMQELGPFRVYGDGKTLYQNEFSWNHGANVLFLESPAGVGFSYSNKSLDSDNGDRGTARENYVFLVNWLERFPEYKDRDLYIAGESYAGHYVPQLAHTILLYNLNLNLNHTIINLKGIIVGNGWMNHETDVRGMYEYYGSHALVSDETTDQIMRYCDFSPHATTEPHQCFEAAEEAISNVSPVYNYNIYAPFCSHYRLAHTPNKASVLYADPCIDEYVSAYLNRPQVQKALHANLTNIPYPWKHCSDDVWNNWHDAPATVLPLLEELIANGLRVWIYSGDIDGNIPVTSTKNSIKELRLPIKTPWRAWYLGEEVGGYTQVYEGELTFATVRGAGHEVPTYQPARAFSIITHFLAGTQLPTSPTNLSPLSLPPN